MELKKYYIILV